MSIGIKWYDHLRPNNDELQLTVINQCAVDHVIKMTKLCIIDHTIIKSDQVMCSFTDLIML